MNQKSENLEKILRILKESLPEGNENQNELKLTVVCNVDRGAATEELFKMLTRVIYYQNETQKILQSMAKTLEKFSLDY